MDNMTMLVDLLNAANRFRRAGEEMASACESFTRLLGQLPIDAANSPGEREIVDRFRGVAENLLQVSVALDKANALF